MKSFIKWFIAKSKMKRWLLLLLIGIILLCYGISMIMTQKTLDNTAVLKIAISFVIGFTSIVISSVFMQKRMLEILVEESDTRKDKNNVNTLIFNKKVYNQGPKVVVLGGGSGLNTVLRGLKHYTDNITAIATLSDYGEEVPIDIKSQLQILPLGDIRDSLIALSYDEGKMEDLLNCRFQDGILKNLSFADIYFLAMNRINGDFTKSIETSNKILNMTGTVIPVTLDPITICAELEDGTIIETRSKIPEEVEKRKSKISRVYITPTNTKPAPGVLESISDADAIIIGPGSLYTNVIPNLLVKGVAREIKNSKAIKIYVSNIMTENGQTDEYTLSDHIKSIEEYVGPGVIDYCIYDTGEVVPEFIQKYNLKGADVVLPDIMKTRELGVKLIQRNLSEIIGDKVKHNPDVIAMTIIQLILDELKFADKQNESQYMMLNSRLKETKREKRRRERREKRFQKSGRKQFERRSPGIESKFGQKYKNRVKAIKESEKNSKLRAKKNSKLPNDYQSRH